MLKIKKKSILINFFLNTLHHIAKNMNPCLNFKI